MLQIQMDGLVYEVQCVFTFHATSVANHRLRQSEMAILLAHSDTLQK